MYRRKIREKKRAVIFFFDWIFNFELVRAQRLRQTINKSNLLSQVAIQWYKSAPLVISIKAEKMEGECKLARRCKMMLSCVYDWPKYIELFILLLESSWITWFAVLSCLSNSHTLQSVQPWMNKICKNVRSKNRGMILEFLFPLLAANRKLLQCLKISYPETLTWKEKNQL